MTEEVLQAVEAFRRRPLPEEMASSTWTACT
jgi:hypothetical protein